MKMIEARVGYIYRLTAALLIAWCGSISADQVTGHGVGATQQAAIDDALRNVVSQHFNTTVVALAASYNSDVLTQSFSIDSGLVTDYEVIEASEKEGLVGVVISANVVDKPLGERPDMVTTWRTEIDAADDISGILDQMRRNRRIREEYQTNFMSDFNKMYRVEMGDVSLIDEETVEFDVYIILQTHVLSTYFDLLKKMPALGKRREREGWFTANKTDVGWGTTRITYAPEESGLMVDSAEPKDKAFYIRFVGVSIGSVGGGLLYRNILSQYHRGVVEESDFIVDKSFSPITPGSLAMRPDGRLPDQYNSPFWAKRPSSTSGLSQGEMFECEDTPTKGLFCGNVFKFSLRGRIPDRVTNLSAIRDTIAKGTTVYVYPVDVNGPITRGDSPSQALASDLASEWDREWHIIH